VRDLLQLSILTASPTFCRRRSSSFRIRAASRAKKKKTWRPPWEAATADPRWRGGGPEHVSESYAFPIEGAPPSSTGTAGTVPSSTDTMRASSGVQFMVHRQRPRYSAGSVHNPGPEVGGNVVDRRLAREVAQSSDAGRLVEGAADREDERKGNLLRGGREKKTKRFSTCGWQWWVISL
jgi:hypothetical protein